MENLLSQMLASTADGAFVIDKNQRIIYWNEAAQEILGYTSAEIVGQSCHEILEGCNDQGQLICGHDCYVATTAFTGEGITNYDVRVRVKSGQTRWVNMSILTFSPNDDKDNPVVVHLFRDVTKKKQNEQFVRHVLNVAHHLNEESLSPIPPSPPSQSSLKDLTAREGEVLSLLAQGLNTPDIAQSLSISSFTVRNHIQNILNKLNVHSRLEAVTYAYEHGLVNKN
jgi:PAS domain S-box-containing protein